MKYAICYGNPLDGAYFEGPFDDIEEASNHAERNAANEPWWIVTLHPPKED